ncbi:MAG: hypothetical protein ACR5LB_09645 [Wolbachia sp.]
MVIPYIIGQIKLPINNGVIPAPLLLLSKQPFLVIPVCDTGIQPFHNH